MNDRLVTACLLIVPRTARVSWLTAGLFFVTLATLMLEVLDTRLLSVVTWYHLSFLAVSVAMLGMAAGAVLVFVGGEFFAPERAVRVLPAAATAFALALPVSHVANLVIPFPAVRGCSPAELAAMAMSTLVLTIPFVLSGIVVTLALTRTRAPIGMLYGADLLGAAAGCLAIIWLLELTDITSTALAAGGAAAIGALVLCALRRRARLVGAAAGGRAVRRGGAQRHGRSSAWRDLSRRAATCGCDDRAIDYSAWNAHSNVIVRTPPSVRCFSGARRRRAGVRGHRWRWPRSTARPAPRSRSGRAPASLRWAQYDVTSLPYRIRNGEVAVIGVGGGRDILTGHLVRQHAHHRHRDQQGRSSAPCAAATGLRRASPIILASRSCTTKPARS